MKQEALHGRQRQLLTLLRAQQQVVTSKELAAQMEVSDRTVRNDVRVLNAVLERYGAAIETTRGKGLILRTDGDSEAMVNDLVHTVSTLQTREDRADYLLVKLLLSDQGLQLGELEDEMFISRTTLENDIRYVRKAISARRPHLYLNRGGNRISIEAPEWRKRLVLTKIFAESWDYHSREGVHLQNSPLNPDIFQFIFDQTKAIVKRFNLKLDDYDLIALVFTIAVAEFRIRTGHPLDEPVAATTDAMKVAPVVKALVDLIEEDTRTVFDDNERRSIMLSFSFRQSTALEAEKREDILHLVDQNALRCTDLFLKQIEDEYGVDFSWDEKLYADLARHIFRLEQRLRYSYERRNPLLPTIKSRYVFFFELAMTIHTCFPAVYGMNLGEDEWGFFADCLISSADRAAKTRYPGGIPAAFISHLGRSDREMMASQIRSVYGNVIDLRGPFSIYEKEKIQAARPELILSTVRLETVRTELAGIPHITLSTAFNDDLFLKLNWYIKEIHEQIFFRPLPQPPVKYFDPRLFFPDLDLSSSEEVITFLTQRLSDLGYATIECRARALEREDWSSTAMENGIAIPRVRVLGPYKTVVACALLRKPIHWSGQKISTVFLLSVSEEDLPIFGTLLNYLVNDLCSRDNRRRLSQVQSYEDLLELL